MEGQSLPRMFDRRSRSSSYNPCLPYMDRVGVTSSPLNLRGSMRILTWDPMKTPIFLPLVSVTDGPGTGVGGVVKTVGLGVEVCLSC